MPSTPTPRFLSKYVLGSFLLIAVFFAVSTVNAQIKKVRLIATETIPPSVRFEELLPTVSLTGISSCASPEELNRYYDGSAEKYETEHAKYAQCINGYTQARLLSEKIASVRGSLSEIDQRLIFLKHTSEYLNSLKELDGLALYGIPAGMVETMRHEYARDIAMKCAVTPPDSSKSLWSVGTLTSDGLPWFNGLPAEQVALIRKAEADNQAIMAQLQKEMKEKGKISISTAMDVAKKAAEMQKLMAGSLMPIIRGDVPANFLAMKPPPVFPLSVAYNRDKSGRPILHEIPSAVLRATAKFLFDVSGPLTDANLSVAGISFNGTWLPEQKMFKELRGAVAKHIQRLTQLRQQFQNILVPLEQKLRALERSNYGCPNP